MKKVCAWCGKKQDDTVDVDQLITHAICAECVRQVLADKGKPLLEFLDGLDAPVVVVDSDVTVQAANSMVRALVEKDLVEIEGHKGGEVFECAYSTLPGGCGNTVHCSGCLIRKTVTRTYATGESFSKVPATLLRATASQPQEIRFLISTEKVGEVVLLRIDEVGETESLAKNQ